MCDQILAAAPGDGDALHTKVVSLIELSKTEEALQVLEATPALEQTCGFEKAYCLYSLYREDEALALLMPKGAEPTEARELQLAGQIKYRKGESSAAAALFRKSEEVAGPSAELSTNILAALVSAGKGAEALEYAKSTGAGDGSSDGDDGTHFELFYNHACAAIATRQLSAAQGLLRKAIDVCRSSLSADDYTEEEVEVRAHGALSAAAPPRISLSSLSVSLLRCCCGYRCRCCCHCCPRTPLPRAPRGPPSPPPPPGVRPPHAP